MDFEQVALRRALPVPVLYLPPVQAQDLRVERAGGGGGGAGVEEVPGTVQEPAHHPPPLLGLCQPRHAAVRRCRQHHPRHCHRGHSWLCAGVQVGRLHSLLTRCKKNEKKYIPGTGIV